MPKTYITSKEMHNTQFLDREIICQDGLPIVFEQIGNELWDFIKDHKLVIPNAKNFYLHVDVRFRKGDGLDETNNYNHSRK